jgi:hypothetical protein
MESEDTGEPLNNREQATRSARATRTQGADEIQRFPDRLLHCDVRGDELLDTPLDQLDDGRPLHIVLGGAPRFHVLLDFREKAQLRLNLHTDVEDVGGKQILRAVVGHEDAP